LVYEDDSDGEMSAIDSDIDHEKEANPKDMLRMRLSVRNAMLNKFNNNKK
jgi:cyanate lyase